MTQTRTHDALPDAAAPCGAPSDTGIATTARGAPSDGERAKWPSIRRGWRRKCPNCGSGALMSGYLKVRDSCPECHEELFHHRADDGPAYLTILIVGHLMAPSLHWVFVTWRPEPLVLFTIFCVSTVALSLYLLPRLKGAIVAYQWSLRLGGFGSLRQSAAPPRESSRPKRTA